MSSGAYTLKFQVSGKVLPGEKLSASFIVSPKSFCYALSTNMFKNVVELKHLVTEGTVTLNHDAAAGISYWIQNAQLHQKKFEKVNVAVLNSDFTMVPEAFAFEKEMKPVLEFASGTQQTKRSQKHQLQQLDFFYGLEPELMALFERWFPNASVRHAGAVTINLLFSHHSLAQATVFLNVSDGIMEIAAKQKKQLLFYNVFSCQNNEDMLYYLLFMMEQFQLNPLNTQVVLAGERPTQDELFKSIKKYIKQVTFCSPDKSVVMSGDLSTIPSHYYFTLLNQHLCEL